MKKYSIYLSTLMLLLGVNEINAQHDVSTNFLGFLASNYSIAYEYNVKDDIGLRAEISQFSNNFDILGEDNIERDYDFTGFKFTPELRVYFSPEKGGDNFFVAPYMRYRKRNVSGDIVLFDDQTSQYVEESFDREANAIGIGLNMGKKWVSDSGFFFEPNFGVGRFITNDISYNNDNVRDYFEVEDDVLEDNFKLDLRFGLNIGWRFGQ